MSNIILGDWFDGGQAKMDLSRLLAARLLLQAGSGFGKSWALRRILEQTAGAVQQFIVDPEGEFATLREKHDYVIAAVNGGDALAHPRTAGLLLRRLMETGVSAILDISELKKPERRKFVRLFVEEMMGLPRAMWSPAIIVVDEAHEFAPEKDEAESLGAIVDLATRGRKRGFALVAATQRIGKLSKDVAAELHNKLIGFTSLDIDVKRAAFELGLTPKDANETLRALKPGDFYAFGPATSQTVQRLRIGPVATTHPEPGTKKFRAPPSPTAAIKAVLSKLADLPKEAEEEARTVEDLRRENAKLKRELNRLEQAAPNSKDVIEAETRGYNRGFNEGANHAYKRGWDEHADAVSNAIASIPKSPPVIGDARPENPVRSANVTPPRRDVAETSPNLAAGARARQIDGRASSELPPVNQRVLNALADLEQMGSDAPDRELVAFMAGYSNVTSKGFANAIGALRTAGLIDYPRTGVIALTDDGRHQATPSPRPRSASELQDRVIRMLGGASGRVLQPLIAAYPKSVPRADLAEAAGYGNVTSKGFANAIGRLRTLGFIDYPDRGAIVAKPVLFLEG